MNRIKKENIIGVFLAVVCLLLAATLIFVTYGKVNTYRHKISSYEKEIAIRDDITEKTTLFGFSKKGNVYLVRKSEELLLLAELINRGKNIEEGLPAAEASYRLTDNIDITGNEWELIGNRNSLFRGSFDGDGHVITGTFRAFFEEGKEAGYLFGKVSDRAKIENISVENVFLRDRDLLHAVLAADFKTDLTSRDYNLKITIENQRQCDELVELLKMVYPNGGLDLNIIQENIDTSELAGVIRSMNEGSMADRGYAVVITWAGQPAGKKFVRIPECLNGFTALLEEDAAFEDLELGENEYLFKIRKEPAGSLSCYIFEFTGQLLDKLPGASQAVVLAEGVWQEDRQVRQVIQIPGMEDLGNVERRITKADVNFDTHSDLLFNLGYRDNGEVKRLVRRGFIWNSTKKEFEYFDSLPEQFSFIDYERRRILDYEEPDTGSEICSIYEIVKNEYLKTGEISVTPASAGKSTVSFYHRGELLKEIEVPEGTCIYDAKTGLNRDFDF